MAKTPRIERLLVIGGLAAGMSAASSAKRLRPEMDVIVLEKSPFISYGTCSIPYYISEEIKDYRDLIAITPEKAETERGLVVRTRHEVIAIDPGGKEVVVRSPDKAGDVKIPFDKLVIATGAVPIKPHLPGIDLKHIFALRTLEDGVAIKQYIDERTIQETGAGSEESAYAKSAHGNGRDQLKAVIVGGGYIGLEMCESIRKRGVDVTLIERMDRVLAQWTGQSLKSSKRR